MDKLLCFEKTTTENPEPIRSNPKLRAEPVLQAWQEWKTRTLTPAFTAPPTAGCTNLHKKIYPRYTTPLIRALRRFHRSDAIGTKKNENRLFTNFE